MVVKFFNRGIPDECHQKMGELSRMAPGSPAWPLLHGGAGASSMTRAHTPSAIFRTSAIRRWESCLRAVLGLSP
jgi:hypothetical protein